MAQQFTPSMTTATVRNEVPTGVQDFVNCTFILANVPTAGSVDLTINGINVSPTTDFTVSGKTITVVEAPHPNDVINADYNF
jgi:hypothetical protein